MKLTFHEADLEDNQRLLEEAGWRYVQDNRNTPWDIIAGGAPTFHWRDPNGRDWWCDSEVPILTNRRRLAK